MAKGKALKQFVLILLCNGAKHFNTYNQSFPYRIIKLMTILFPFYSHYMRCIRQQLLGLTICHQRLLPSFNCTIIKCTERAI